MANFPSVHLLKPRLKLSAQWWHHRLIVPGLLLCTIFLGVMAWQFNVMSDHTNNHRNTLSTASTDVLKALPDRIEITAFCSNTPYKGRYFRKSIQALVQRYQHLHADVYLQFIDPAGAPTLAREQQIKKEGEMIISYRGQQKRMYLPYTEEALTNVLLQLQHGERAPVLFASGHGEPELDNTSSHGASQLAQSLRNTGVRVLNSASFENYASPDKKLPTLVLAGATRTYTKTQTDAIQSHITQGGNLVWLVDSAKTQGLETLAETLGLTISKGILIDPANRQFDIPLHALSTQHYSTQGFTQEFLLRTFFDEAHAIERYRQPADAWRTIPLVAAAEHGWTSEIYSLRHPEKLPAFNANTDIQGPATVVLALEKQLKTGELQRVLMIASTQFFTNAQQQRGGNLALAMQSLEWVVNNQPSITLPPVPLRDSVIVLPEKTIWLMIMFNSFQFGLPALLLFFSCLKWRKRQVR